MFQALFEHIDYATNGGNLRATMTVFPSGQGPTSPRVWSTQLFRYAGYRADDGSVLGDPANLELTEVALALGWQPPKPRTAFDILPLIVQIGGRRPQFRDIPRSLVLEVPIIHPDLPFFQELGLKWYALPAVSNVLLDAGGVIYKAAPFNGWYQGTEIGARNFSDPYRYNLLPEVARRMGLDQTSDRTLWRDRALLELNVAVLYSYEKAGVKMMDHHATSHAFDQFEAAEREAGRVVHARWNWIVPPISGSAVTIFHRDTWQDITLKPNYFYQPDPWIADTSWR
jgi:nitric-oxide synthase